MSDAAAAEPAPAPIRRNGYTNESLAWRAWLHPLDLAQASPLQLQVLDDWRQPSRNRPACCRHAWFCCHFLVFPTGIIG